jgi:hypothetical protein
VCVCEAFIQLIKFFRFERMKCEYFCNFEDQANKNDENISLKYTK